jgi:hypothetical protein
MDRSPEVDTSNLITDSSRMAAMMIGFPECRVLSVDEDTDGLHVSVETSDDEVCCRSCEEPATLEGRSVVVRHSEGLAFGRPMELLWQLRRWRCSSPVCTARSWTEDVPPSVRGD